MPQTITCKLGTFYVAIAPTAGLWACGACFEEAVNSLAEHTAASKLQEGDYPGEILAFTTLYH